MGFTGRAGNLTDCSEMGFTWRAGNLMRCSEIHKHLGSERQALPTALNEILP
jgi:hypothetical protein